MYMYLLYYGQVHMMTINITSHMTGYLLLVSGGEAVTWCGFTTLGQGKSKSNNSSTIVKSK